jgi:hypothetical protein
VYDSTGTPVGSKTELYKSKYKSDYILHSFRAVTSGQVYYIKVTPYSTYSGAYQIMFSDSFIPKDADIVDIIGDTWVDGNIKVPAELKSDDVEQWYKFTASANTKYIHTDGSTLKIQLFDIKGTAIGEENTVPPLLAKDPKYVSISVNNDEVYYIRVKLGSAYFSNGADNKYTIGITQSQTKLPVITLPAEEDVTELPDNRLIDGGELQRDDVRWFKFTATANIQYIHFIISGWTSETTAFGQLYDDTGAAVGEQIRWAAYSETDTVKSCTVVNGNEYYLKVTIYYNYGTYQIGYNDSSTPPRITLPTENVTQLTADTFSAGTLSSSAPEQWYKFTASDNTQYILFKPGATSPVTRVNVQLYDSDGKILGEKTGLDYNSSPICKEVENGEVYHIKVTANRSGSYQITFSKNFPPATTATLTLGTFTSGSITTTDLEQWYEFTATANTQYYIHFKATGTGTGNLTAIYVQLYDVNGTCIGDCEMNYASKTPISRTVTTAGKCYIKVTSYYNSSNNLNAGAYSMAVSTSSTAPTP